MKEKMHENTSASRGQSKTKLFCYTIDSALFIDYITYLKYLYFSSIIYK